VKRTGRQVRGGGRPGRRTPAPEAIGVDTGGTFTDFVALVRGEVIPFKVLSTPSSPHRAVLAGLRRAHAARTTRVRHGSTVATNTLLERKGARVSLVTTAGFEDLLEIGRQERLDLYALRTARIEPLVPAERRLGVRERTGPRGESLVPLDRPALARTLAEVRRSRPEVVAVGLLHAYANPANERRVARALRSGGWSVTTSFDVSPEVREYERLSTTVVNAYLLPRVSRYLEGLARGTPAGIEVVLSHGGTAAPDEAAREPVRQLLSGPAAGVKAAAAVANHAGFARALTLDVGGTSTDCAFIDGEPPRRRGRDVAGFPIQLPMLDVHTVGAGGGSMARVDSGGLLRVGPESAGANPGPACYGRGGPATVTDALVVLGRIPGDSLAGGSLRLDRRAATLALQRLGRELGRRDAVRAAEGVLAVANAHMEAALRNVSVERGHDPRRAALVAFGGAGGLHACELAGALGARTVLFPRHAGVLSAVGALIGGARRERSRSVLLDAGRVREIEASWRELEAEVALAFPRGARRGIRLERWAEVRYRGQSHEVTLAGGPGLAERFHRAHRERFGFSREGSAIEVVTLDVRGHIPGDRVPEAPPPAAPAAGAARTGRTWSGGAWRTVPVLARERIGRGRALRGPAVVFEEGATLWIAGGWSARAHSSGALVLTRGPAR
jgi:N-methylhydantoinase A